MHISHDMHSNSLDTWKKINTGIRVIKVYRLYMKYKNLTDRQSMRLLNFKDMNTVRPAITILSTYIGLLDEIGSVKDKETRKRVRKCRSRIKTRRPFKFKYKLIDGEGRIKIRKRIIPFKEIIKLHNQLMGVNNEI